MKLPPIAKALIVDEPYCEYILTNKKTWDMRSSKTSIRGVIGLIKKGTGTVVGFAELIDCLGPLSDSEMIQSIEKHRLSIEDINSPDKKKWRYAWVIKNVHPFPEPIKYVHPKGAVIWVNLNSDCFEIVSTN